MNSSFRNVHRSNSPHSKPIEGNSDQVFNKVDLQDAAAKRLAQRLFHLEGFNDQEVTTQLLRRSSFYDLVAREYLMQFNFTDLSLEDSLRMFLAKFSLAGESQEKERILQFFSQRYVQCQPDGRYSQETCHLLACALLLLNTDLHHEEVHKKMTCSEFINNFTQASAAFNKQSGLSRETLKMFYENIKKSPLLRPETSHRDRVDLTLTNDTCYHEDHVESYQRHLQNIVIMCSYVTRKCIFEGYGKRTGVFKRRSCVVFMRLCGLQLQCYRSHNAAGVVTSESRSHARSPISHQRESSSVTDEPDDKLFPGTEDSSSLSLPESTLKSQCEMMANSCKTSSGTPMSSSTMSLSLTSMSWKQIFTPQSLLSTPPLCKGNSVQCGACISIHHALARLHTSHVSASTLNDGDTRCLGLPPTGSRQRQKSHDNSQSISTSSFGFRLFTADGAQYLFQVATEDLLKRWIKAINYTSALLSSPPLPCPIGSQCNSFRPIYQLSYTTLSQKDQIRRYKDHSIYLKAELMRCEAIKKNLSSSQSTTSRERLNDVDEKITFLLFEIGRFQTYLDILNPDADGECTSGGDELLSFTQDANATSHAMSECSHPDKLSSHLRTNSVSVLSDLFSKNCPSRASSHKSGFLKLLQRKHMS